MFCGNHGGANNLSVSYNRFSDYSGYPVASTGIFINDEYVIANLQLASVFEPFLSFDYIRDAFGHPSFPELVDYKLRQFPPSP